MCRGISPTTAAKLLVDAGAVSRRRGKLIAIQRAAILPNQSALAHLRAIKVSTQLIRTLVHNMSSKDIRKYGQFERTVMFDSLEPKYLPALQAYIEQHGQAFLEQVDDWIAARASATRNSRTRRIAVGTGVFLFSHTDTSE
jgi:hypothetical protein